MSLDAARLLRIEQNELWEFLSYAPVVHQSDAPNPQIPKFPKQQDAAAKMTDGTKNAILIISIVLFSVAFLVCVIVFTVWALGRRKNKNKDGGHGHKNKMADECVEQPCDEKALHGVFKSTPSLPQIFDKPKLPFHIAGKTSPHPPTTGSPGGEELRHLSVGRLELASNFYTNRNRLQFNVREVDLTNFDESLRDNAFAYLVFSIQSEEKAFEPPYCESELSPISDTIFFDESAEFEVTFEDIALITVKIAVFASDRFSQHRLLNEYTYSLGVGTEFAETPSKPAILPLLVSETSRSEDITLPEEQRKEGELLFSLCYMPTSGRLTFVALKGRNISEEREGPLGTYLRVNLIVSGKTVKTVQTTSVQNSVNPVYNEAFVFHTPLERIKDTDIVISVCSSDEDLKSQQQPKVLGKLIVGPSSDLNLGRKHWEAMLSTPRRPVAQWHVIS